MNQPNIIQQRIAKQYGTMFMSVKNSLTFGEKIDRNKELEKFAADWRVTMDGNYIISVGKDRVAYFETINMNTGQPLKNYRLKLF